MSDLELHHPSNTSIVFGDTDSIIIDLNNTTEAVFKRQIDDINDMMNTIPTEEIEYDTKAESWL